MLISLLSVVLFVGCSANQNQEDASHDSEGDGEKMTELVLNSFDGGGPQYKVFIEDEEIVRYTSSIHYFDENHEELDGAAYQVIYEFEGLKEGETTMRVEERSPITLNVDRTYQIKVDKNLKVDIEMLTIEDVNTETDDEEVIIEGDDMKLFIAGEEVPVTWEVNESVNALKDACPITVSLHMYGGFEQVGPLGFTVVSDDEYTTTEAGDIVLYSSNQIVVFYGSNSWDYTRLGHVNLTKEEMKELLGNGDVEIRFE